ncbi:DUF2071 domain-containing protein [Streptomyces sp. NPDC050743]|uniref:DUF2071 domain-containing protein n=1 Tax=Streptomyces sp. NPDC050743 TaxID=3365634 RepID=UPI003788B288
MRDPGPPASGRAEFRRGPPGESVRVVSYGPEQRVDLPALRAGWLTQTFVHWAYSPEQVQRLLPEGLTVDTCEQWAWVSVSNQLSGPMRTVRSGKGSAHLGGDA